MVSKDFSIKYLFLLGIIFFLGCDPSLDPVLMGEDFYKNSQKASWDFEYIGSFNVPDNSEFNYALAGLAYSQSGNNGNGSLFIGGHDWRQQIAEISIPEPEKNSDVTKLPFSEILQDFTDKIYEKSRYVLEDGSLLDTSLKIGGLLVYNNELYGTAYAYYTGAYDAKRSHYKTSLDLTDSAIESNFKGMFTIGDLNPGHTAGYMTVIPESKRSLFGGAVMVTGQTGLAIVTRSSWGPSLHTFFPEEFNDSFFDKKLTSKPLIDYPSTNPTLGTWGNKEISNPSYNMTTSVSGVVYPDNSNYVYFIGTTGLGIPAYGAGSKDPKDEIYDTVSQSKGCHAWPYANYLWIYSENDLKAVYDGEKNPWEIIPVEEGVLELPYYDINVSCGLTGVTYDVQNKRLYISAKFKNGTKPVIHVYEFKN
ncbi:MAG: hypothetical protein JXR63_05270 [Spirochaetales bacterium]|nr:hypothetical protein [Spirochaetales bacterium]